LCFFGYSYIIYTYLLILNVSNYRNFKWASWAKIKKENSITHNMRMIAKFLLRLILFFSILLFFDSGSFSQVQNDINDIDSGLIQSHLNKIFIPQFKFQALKALCHYPELKNTKIVFKFKKIKTTLACRPKLISIFLRKEKRTYLILINNDSSKLKNAILPLIPEAIQIGVIGHEMGHIIDYHDKGFFRIMATGIGYFFTGYKSRLEKKVDRITIEHGLKQEIIAYSNYIINTSNAPLKYKNYKRKIYYLPEDLEKL